MTNMPTAGAKNVQKTCQTMHSDMTSRELVFHPQEGALAVEARPGDHYQLYPFDHFQSNGPGKSAPFLCQIRYFANLEFCGILCGSPYLTIRYQEAILDLVLGISKVKSYCRTK